MLMLGTLRAWKQRVLLGWPKAPIAAVVTPWGVRHDVEAPSSKPASAVPLLGPPAPPLLLPPPALPFALRLRSLSSSAALGGRMASLVVAICCSRAARMRRRSCDGYVARST